MERIEVVKDDITRMNVDAIVNAANTSLLGGGGVDGAIHRAAGEDLLKETKTLGGCPTGEARITKGYKLPARYVIHTVGPVWNGGKMREEELLASCYSNSLELAQKNNCHTVAFPNISTGIYRFPKDKAAKIAINTVKEFLNENQIPKKVIFVVFDEENLRIYQDLLGF